MHFQRCQLQTQHNFPGSDLCHTESNWQLHSMKRWPKNCIQQFLRWKESQYNKSFLPSQRSLKRIRDHAQDLSDTTSLDHPQALDNRNSCKIYETEHVRIISNYMLKGQKWIVSNIL